MKTLFSLFAAVVLLCGCRQQPQEIAWEDQTPEQHLEHWRNSARFELMKECTNEIVGLSRIIETQINDSSGNVGQWTAEVTAEHINHYGGIERTNMLFCFSPWRDQVNCLRDGMREYDREIQRIQAGLK